jgi:chromosome segregation ATPase
MAKPISSSETFRNGPNALRGLAAPSTERRGTAKEEALRAAGVELLRDDDFRDELGRLADQHRQVRDQLEQQLDATAATPGGAELERLREENEKLQRRITELELFSEDLQKEQSAWDGRQREYEGLLDEKSEVIRELHHRLHEQPERASAGTPREEELIALSEELERERRQLKEDEEALMEQMRQMEVGMSRERAELARQRNELTRLQNDVRHELELAARDATLRDRLAPLQRRHQELVNRHGGTATTARSAATPDAPSPVRSEPEQDQGAKDNGLFRRLFG